MPALRTEITEIVTGLGTLGAPDLASLMGPEPPPELRNVDRATWDRLVEAHQSRTNQHDELAAWNNGRALFRADDGLRGRPPRIVEWKGAHRDPAAEAVPADLRIDHVYLVSCKYLSKVLHNASPWSLFERYLSGTAGRSEPDWFDTVAAAEHQHLYQLVRARFGGGIDLPERVGAMTKAQRRALSAQIPRDWPSECVDAYRELAVTTSERSADRWRSGLGSDRERAAMVWRLLRLGPAPYFVLGTGARSSLRIRVATPWDWRATYELRGFEVVADGTGQARLSWTAAVRERGTTNDVDVAGHVEIRWSHGRFGGPPEAKVYLDTPHARVPGYFPLV